MLRRLRTLVAAATALCGAPLFAHDLWIEPGTFSPQAGQSVGLRLRVGQDLSGDPLPLNPALVKRFIVDDAAGSRPVAAWRGADPAGLVRVGAPGLLVAAYHSHSSRVELAAEKFNAYLLEEGLDSIVALRERRNQAGSSGRERFARCAKSLLLAGPVIEAQRDRQLGCPLELVAERNPYASNTNPDFALRLSYEGEPLAGALVVAINSLNPAHKQQARSDADGRVRFALSPGGMWLVKAVHMVAAPASTDGDADWLSFWASLTFEVRASP